jgi:hypothetical protein
MLAFEFVALLPATLFAGAAIYVTLVEYPARMQCGTELAATVFGPSYRRAAVMQADSRPPSQASAPGLRALRGSGLQARY